MKPIASIGTASSVPKLPEKLPEMPENGGWFLVFGAPVVWFFLNKGWEAYQEARKVDNRREEKEIDSVATLVSRSIENKDKLLEQIQSQQKSLLDDVVKRHDEALSNLESSMAILAQVQSTMAENLRVYSEVSKSRSDEIARLLSNLESFSARTNIEALNSHIRISQVVSRNQETMKQHLLQVIEITKRLHDRMDKHFGPDLDSRHV